MTRTPDASAADDALQARLRALLQAGDLDAALQAGLMRYPASPGAADAPIRAAQEQLRHAWAARERHRARDARLARQAADRAARRAARTVEGSPPGAAAPVPAAGAAPDASPARPAAALPPAAAAALARARARAAGKPPA